MPQPSHRILAPKALGTGVVFASPHSGAAYEDAFLRKSVLDGMAIRSSEDAFVDKLFDAVPLMGAPLLVADVPRAFVDLNRAADELDPALIDGARGASHNPRISSGLGVIPRVVANGRAIYRGKIPMAEARLRLAEHWHPYHRALRGLLDEARVQFGSTILIDCHSMPHEAIDQAGGASNRPDIVLGDRFGAACGATIMRRIEQAFVDAGFKVARNAPFAGAYVTQHYGRPSRAQHAVQVEIDRALYMDEATIQPLPQFDAVKRRLTRAISDIAEIGRPARSMPLAAE